MKETNLTENLLNGVQINDEKNNKDLLYLDEMKERIMEYKRFQEEKTKELKSKLVNVVKIFKSEKLNINSIDHVSVRGVHRDYTISANNLDRSEPEFFQVELNCSTTVKRLREKTVEELRERLKVKLSDLGLKVNFSHHDFVSYGRNEDIAKLDNISIILYF